MEVKTIKSISTKHYEIEVVQIGDYYRIFYQSGRGMTQASEIINDFNTASYLFDLKLADLEGN